MDRLTTWNGKKYVLPQGRTSAGESYWRIIAERLAAYENTGLTPEEINAMRGYLAGDCNCCERSGSCDFFANLSFPEKTTDCLWEFRRALVKEAK